MSSPRRAYKTQIAPGDLVFNSDAGWDDGRRASAVNLGLISPCVRRVLPLRRLSADDTAATVPGCRRTRHARRIEGVMGRGVTAFSLHDAVQAAPIAFPPLDEQAAIVRFLDHADRRIRRYIRAKQKLIALLKEQKQAIIHRAVTRGLDPNVRLKPSGVDWLGDVPEHWEVVQARSGCRAVERDCHRKRRSASRAWRPDPSRRDSTSGQSTDRRRL